MLIPLTVCVDIDLNIRPTISLTIVDARHSGYTPHESAIAYTGENSIELVDGAEIGDYCQSCY